MNGHEQADVQPLARHDDGPVFDEPWQAQVLALAFNLIERGQFTGSQWSEALGAELEAAREREDSDDMATYYSAVLAALEGLLDAESDLSKVNLDARTEQWRQAYLRTPHGQPVDLDQ